MWEVVCLFDYDDYYQAGKDVIVNGKFTYMRRGRRFRNKEDAQKFVDKLNEEESCLQQ